MEALLFNLITPQAYIELRSNISKRSYIVCEAYITRRKANKTQLAAGKHHSAFPNITVLQHNITLQFIAKHHSPQGE